jgi:hypothetical protein
VGDPTRWLLLIALLLAVLTALHLREAREALGTAQECVATLHQCVDAPGVCRGAR